MFWTILFALSAVALTIAYLRSPLFRGALSIGWILLKGYCRHKSKPIAAEAELVGKCIKVPFTFQQKEYYVYLPFDSAANKSTVIQMMSDDVLSDMKYCPGIAVYFTAKDLAAEKVFVYVDGDPAREFTEQQDIILS